MRTIAVLFLAAVAAAAQIESPAKDTAAGDPMVDYYRSLADHFRMSERAIYSIRDKIGNDAEVAAVLVVARRSNASPNQVIEARKAGKDWPAVLSQWKVKSESDKFVDEANTWFLSQYHGRKPEEVKTLRDKGLDYIAINQEFRRAGTGVDERGRVLPTDRSRKAKGSSGDDAKASTPQSPQ